jgi:hypothetical protein
MVDGSGFAADRKLVIFRINARRTTLEISLPKMALSFVSSGTIVYEYYYRLVLRGVLIMVISICATVEAYIFIVPSSPVLSLRDKMS